MTSLTSLIKLVNMSETPRKISAFEARTHLGEVLDYIRYSKKPCLVERHGTLVAAIIDIETYKRQTLFIQYDEWVKTAIAQIKKHYDPQKIILFGSASSGRVSEGSDIDILIVKATDKRALDRIDEVMEFMEHGIPLELHIFTPEEIAERLNLGDFFIKDIFENGKVLYERQK